MQNRQMSSKSRISGGFTLIEVIISIAVLSICSIFILQMFVTSAQLNRNARDIDRANAMLSTILENCSVQKVSAGETNIYYDGEWNPCQPEAARFMIATVVEHVEDGPAVPVSLADNAEVRRGVLYRVSCTVLFLNTQGTNLPIAQASASVYYAEQEGAA